MKDISFFFDKELILLFGNIDRQTTEHNIIFYIKSQSKNLTMFESNAIGQPDTRNLKYCLENEIHNEEISKNQQTTQTVIHSNLDEEQTINTVLKAFVSASKDQLVKYLRQLVVFIKKGYAQNIMKDSSVMKKILIFNAQLSSQLDKDPSNQQKELQFIYTLSIIAQLMRQCPTKAINIPKKFIMAVFTLNSEMIESSTKSKDLLAILGVIYEHLSRQSKLMKKLELFQKLKYQLLENYSFISEFYTLKVFNRALFNLASQNVLLTQPNFEKYQIYKTLGKFFSESQMEHVKRKLQQKLPGLQMRESASSNNQDNLLAMRQ